MARTPEGKVKDRIRALLIKNNVLYFMPVQNGYGAPALDFIICAGGRYAQIETKAGEGVMTPRQAAVAIAVENAGSIAGMILTTEAVISEIKSDNPAPMMPPGGGGMPGMM